MGFDSWKSTDFDTYSDRHIKGKTTAEIFTSRSMVASLDAAKIGLRESRDSDINPQATPVILASDITGSMGRIAHTLMQTGLNTVATEIYDRKPIADPHIMVMGIGDGETDRAPAQATQFEAGAVALAEQVRQIYVEGGGGGNQGESYSFAHLFAGLKTSHDAMEKRGKKGFLFTIGDEPILPKTPAVQAKRFLGLDMERTLTARECLEIAQRSYEVFHIVIAEGYASYDRGRVLNSWKPLLPERTIWLDDYNKLGEVIVSALQVHAGVDKDDIAKSWGDGTSLVVMNAIRDLAVGGAGGGVQRL